MAQLCFNTMNASPYLAGESGPSLVDQVAAAAAAGFEQFGADEASLGGLISAGGSLAGFAEQVHAAGMGIFELPTLMLGADSARNQASTARLAGYAAELKPAFVQLNIDSAITAAVVDDLRRAGDAFAAHGVRMAIEYLPWLPAVRSLNSTRELLARAGVEGAGVLVDTWHFHFSDDSFSDLEDLPLSELAYVQFDDHPALEGDDLLTETIMRRVMPGEGVIELQRFADICRSKGYDGVISCEVLSDTTRAMDINSYAQSVYSSTRAFWPN